MKRPNPLTGRIAIRPFLVAALAATLAACDAPSVQETPPVRGLAVLPSPAAPASGEPNLTVGPDGAVHLSWLEPSETGHALRFARLEDGSWTEPRTIIDRSDLFVNWADFPSLAFFGGGDGSVLAAHWLEMSGPGPYSYDVRMALSRDGGETWGPDFVVHRDGVEAEHGFVSLIPHPGPVLPESAGGAGGGDRQKSGDAPSLAALWLDGRATVDGDPMTLRFTTVDAAGRLGPEHRVDGSVCDCCQTALARTADGLVAVYRNRTADEVRDIYAARYVDGTWSEGRPVHEDRWVIDACPVNGPAVAATGDTVVVTWFTAAAPGAGAAGDDEAGTAGGHGRVLAAFSTDGGRSFGPPVRVDDGAAMGRVDVLGTGGETAVVSWLERTADGAEVRARRVAPSGVGPAVTVAGTAAERATGFPRMVRSGDRVVFAWTASGEDGGVRTATGTLAPPVAPASGPATANGEDG